MLDTKRVHIYSYYGDGLLGLNSIMVVYIYIYIFIFIYIYIYGPFYPKP